MAGRVVTYNDRVTPVQLGDHVLTRVWFRKRKGRVVYVPGVSALNTNMEYNGLCWVGIRLDDGGFVSTVVDPEGAYLLPVPHRPPRRLAHLGRAVAARAAGHRDLAGSPCRRPGA